MIELHEIKYYTVKDISKRFPVSEDFILKKIDEEELDACLIDGETYVPEDALLEFFTKKKS